MNYALTDLPDSGKEPVVYMDIGLKGEPLGKIQIRLFRDVFPAGVENFVKLAAGKTFKVEPRGDGKYKYQKETKRSYEGSKFFRLSHNNYIVGGDIYHNNGATAGTIYNDQPIPAIFGDYYYPHDTKGLVSLVPFKDENNNKLYYDSTFMITLDDAKPSNVLSDLDSDQIVIGQVISGMDVLDKINQLIKPYAGRKYPEFYILRSDVYRPKSGFRRIRPMSRSDRKKFNKPPQKLNE